MIRATWKPVYIKNCYYLNSKLFFFFSKKQQLTIIWHRNNTIFPELLNSSIKVHNGSNYKNIIIKETMFFHKIGEFFLTRKKTKFVVKNKKIKNKKK